MSDRYRVLICDDEEGVRESLKLILEDNYDLSYATNGNEAIEKLKKEKFDIVILDIKMPRISGIETLKELKSISPDTKFIIVSAYKSVEVASEAVKSGANDYIVKPFDRWDVIKRVANQLTK